MLSSATPPHDSLIELANSHLTLTPMQFNALIAVSRVHAHILFVIYTKALTHSVGVIVWIHVSLSGPIIWR